MLCYWLVYSTYLPLHKINQLMFKIDMDSVLDVGGIEV